MNSTNKGTGCHQPVYDLPDHHSIKKTTWNSSPTHQLSLNLALLLTNDNNNIKTLNKFLGSRITVTLISWRNHNFIPQFKPNPTTDAGCF